MSDNKYMIWLDTVDDDGDYGRVVMCRTCNLKSYRCKCADGKSVKTEDGFIMKAGDRAFNYYDMKEGTISNISDDGWFDFQQDDKTVALLNGQRICSIKFAEAKGWRK